MAQHSGQLTITAAGTAEQGPDIGCTSVLIKALHANTGMVYVGDDGNGDVTSSTGYVLDAGEEVELYVWNLKGLWFDADTTGEGISWIIHHG